MRRIPQWFVFAWVIVFALGSVGGAVLAYSYVRERATELDEVVDLPELPQLSGLNPFAIEDEPSEDVADPLLDAEEAPVVDDFSDGEVGDVAGDPAEPGSAPEEGEEPAEVAAAPDTEASGDEAEAAADMQPADAETVSAEAEALAQLEPWDDPRRVTILLMGIDQREGETGPFPTDTMILLSIDPAGKTAAVLTIPRDLWVEFPGLQEPGKINTAMIRGDQVNYPGGGGPALAMKTVERTLGVPVHYYVVINFEVFIEVIDAIGPIEVCPPEPIDDDEYPDGSYGTISIHFDAGCQELDSERLLQYARTRHGNSDIDRSRRQQEVIMATRDRVLSAGGVISLIPRAPALWESIQENVRTNLSLQEIIRLALAAESIESENIRQGQITFEEVLMQQSPQGEDILVPISTDIRLLIQDLFRPAGTPSQRPASAPEASESAGS